MRRRLALTAGLAAACAALSARSMSRASDHLDGPRTTADREADIADVFAFTSPQDPSRIVLAMTVFPFASSQTAFSSRIDYAFRVRRVSATQPPVLDDAPFDVVCNFDDATAGSPQHVTCSTAAGQQATASVGDEAGGGGAQGSLRVFAGLRSDPAFFDRRGALASLSSGRAQFSGENTFLGANVLAIVVEVGATALGWADDGGGPEAGTSLLAVAAETVQRHP